MYPLTWSSRRSGNKIRLGTMRSRVRSLASLSGLRIQRCCALWCRLQTQLGSHVPVVWTGGCSSNQTPAWEPPHAMRVTLKSKKKKKKKSVH